MDKPRLLDQLRTAIRYRHYSVRTEQCYCQWAKRYIRFHNLRHPAEMGRDEIVQFLSHLAIDRKVAASTQNQALNALLFLYRQVIHNDPGWLDGFVYAKKPKRLPVVCTREEVKRILSELEGIPWLATALLYGSGLRLTECISLRIKDIDFDYKQITVRGGKGNKDRVTVLPNELRQPLQLHFDVLKLAHKRELASGSGVVYLPPEQQRRYASSSKDWG